MINNIFIYLYETLGNHQSEFRKNKSTAEHEFLTRNIMKKMYEFTRDLYMVFVDYKQAYNSIENNYGKHLTTFV